MERGHCAAGQRDETRRCGAIAMFVQGVFSAECRANGREWNVIRAFERGGVWPGALLLDACGARKAFEYREEIGAIGVVGEVGGVKEEMPRVHDLEDIAYEEYVRARIRAGIESAEREPTVSLEEAKIQLVEVIRRASQERAR